MKRTVYQRGEERCIAGVYRNIKEKILEIRKMEFSQPSAYRLRSSGLGFRLVW